ncbi:hypothetical protein [Phyllobacterium phragmitis]|uniref:hypothetical protein n=1 Tax=Phyllobacterium phragmitis TaxID=2670329 RepID=UPI0018ECFA8F|nr:hypothetical protein [Phyllobacterium phragmitis]
MMHKDIQTLEHAARTAMAGAYEPARMDAPSSRAAYILAGIAALAAAAYFMFA